MLDTVTLPSTPAPRRCWTPDDDLDAAMQRSIGVSDEDIGRMLGRSAKAVHHRRARLAQLAAAPRPAAPSLGSDLARAAADVEAAEVAVEQMHRRYAEVMGPYLRPVADALRIAGVCGTTGGGDDLRQDGHAWRLVEALAQIGVELKVPA